MHAGTRTLITISLFLLSFAVVLPSAPVFHALPHRDSGVFLYIGQQILEGQVPYRDIWDHKGPLIFYMNALGLALSGGSEWGVWVLQLFLLWTAAYLGYTALDRQLGAGASLLSTVVWLANLALVWDGGNRVEGFALAFQFAALYALCRLEHRRLQALVVGCSFALSFLLRPELAALPLTVGVYLVGSRACARHFRASLDCGLSIAAGGTAVFLLAILVFWPQNALGSMVDATLLYNLAYVSTPPLAHFAAISGGSKVLRICFAGYVASGLLLLWSLVPNRLPQPPTALRLVGLGSFGLALVGVGLSGMGYRHYYIALLPPIHILLCLLFWLVSSTAEMAHLPPFLGGRAFRHTCGLLIALALNTDAIWSMGVQMGQSAQMLNHPVHPVVAYLAANVQEDDYVLVWGAEASINFLSGHRSPTRYAYQYPLYTIGYQDNEKTLEFLHDIEARKPSVIIDTSSTNPAIPPLDPSQRQQWAPSRAWFRAPSAMADVYAYIDTHYRQAKVIESLDWRIYGVVGN